MRHRDEPEFEAQLEQDRGLLGALLFDSGAYDEIRSLLPIDGANFGLEIHERIFNCIIEWVELGQLVEPTRLHTVLMNGDEREGYEYEGGLRYLADLGDMAAPKEAVVALAQAIKARADSGIRFVDGAELDREMESLIAQVNARPVTDRELREGHALAAKGALIKKAEVFEESADRLEECDARPWLVAAIREEGGRLRHVADALFEWHRNERAP